MVNGIEVLFKPKKRHALKPETTKQNQPKQNETCLWLAFTAACLQLAFTLVCSGLVAVSFHLVLLVVSFYLSVWAKYSIYSFCFLLVVLHFQCFGF